MQVCNHRRSDSNTFFFSPVPDTTVSYGTGSFRATLWADILQFPVPTKRYTLLNFKAIKNLLLLLLWADYDNYSQAEEQGEIPLPHGLFHSGGIVWLSNIPSKKESV